MCGEAPSVTALIDYEGFCGMPAHDRDEAPVRERSAADVAAMRARGDAFLFLDVREPHEFETARIEGTRLVPLATVAARAEEFAEWKHGPVVVHCYRGRTQREGLPDARAARLPRRLESDGRHRGLVAHGRSGCAALLARGWGEQPNMAKSAIPNPLERRHLVERDATPEASLRLAEAYLAEGRGWEAIVFLAEGGRARSARGAARGGDRRGRLLPGARTHARPRRRVAGCAVARHIGSGGRRRQGTLRGFGTSHGRTSGGSIMTLKSFVVRGLAKEVEEDLNKFLAARPGIEIVQMGQSESGDHISVVLIFDEPDPLV